jgi:hypothetical protein
MLLAPGNPAHLQKVSCPLLHTQIGHSDQHLERLLGFASPDSRAACTSPTQPIFLSPVIGLSLQRQQSKHEVSSVGGWPPPHRSNVKRFMSISSDERELAAHLFRTAYLRDSRTSPTSRTRFLARLRSNSMHVCPLTITVHCLL